ncbi:hypothetical protein K469DRAFT_701680 [Zopfia rhizophila CBS 207.26]|uniref:Uncharacterized protein n=1 Tax=Zopfia rhizophila CBS 207.26 TaxID=1314779 RepID=A0A6A6EAW9_9PEZI|nr:hypothetical protein K469DRAFT_701680 [Zopfia rhizophila CBS 207.26]
MLLINRASWLVANTPLKSWRCCSSNSKSLDLNFLALGWALKYSCSTLLSATTTPCSVAENFYSDPALLTS